MAKVIYTKNAVSFRDQRAAAEAKATDEKLQKEVYARIFLHQFFKFGLLRNCKMPF